LKAGKYFHYNIIFWKVQKYCPDATHSLKLVFLSRGAGDQSHFAEMSFYASQGVDQRRADGERRQDLG
jgi:hypothetical protein